MLALGLAEEAVGGLVAAGLAQAGEGFDLLGQPVGAGFLGRLRSA